MLICLSKILYGELKNLSTLSWGAHRKVGFLCFFEGLVNWRSFFIFVSILNGSDVLEVIL